MIFLPKMHNTLGKLYILTVWWFTTKKGNVSAFFVWFHFSSSYFSSCLDFLFLSNHLGTEALRKPVSCRWNAPTSIMRDKKQNAPLGCSVFVWSISIVYKDYSAPMESPMYFNEWCKMAIHYSPHVVFSPCIFCVWPKLDFFPSDPKRTWFLHRNPSVPPLILGVPRLELENGNSSPNASCPAVGWMAWCYRILAFLPPWMYHQIVPAGKVHKELF